MKAGDKEGSKKSAETLNVIQVTPTTENCTMAIGV